MWRTPKSSAAQISTGGYTGNKKGAPHGAPLKRYL
jgi:hypothetical protein